VRTAWDDKIGVEPHKFIGAAIYMRGVHDLPVCEVLWRLAGPGEAAVDVGANIGVMTSLLSRRVGAQGRVFAFEAHPEVFQQLELNVGRWKRPWIEVHNRVVSCGSAGVTLNEGDVFGLNEGTARVAKASLCGRSFEVPSVRLDDVLTPGTCIVAKIDVEGHETEVLSGASEHLAKQFLRDLVFESTWDFPGPAHELLLGYGYCILEVQPWLRGPKLAPVLRRSGGQGRVMDYVATGNVRRAQELMRPAGWQVLRRQEHLTLP
jgi:FkbM family methyltransferase